VNGVMLAALANSSFVTSNSTPPGTVRPIVCARPDRTSPSRCSAVWQVSDT
jgi:hypothetical protein